MIGPGRISRVGATNRSLLVAVLALAFGPALLVGSAFGASAPEAVPPRIHPWTAYVVSPKPGAVLQGPSVHVVLHVRSKARSVRVKLAGNAIGGEFRRRGNRRIATLEVGSTPGLHFGRNVIRMRTADGKGRRSHTSVAFYLIGRSTSLVRSITARSVPGAGGKIELKLGSKHARLTVQVNGGPKLRRSPDARATTIELDADNGLRPGLNRIRVLAVDRAAGRYAVRRVRLSRPVDVPVAGAGVTPRRRRVGHSIRLDAGASRAPRGDGLRYHWRIVKAPGGSHAKLHGAFRVRPTLRPDRPGRYVLSVGVAKVSPGAAHASDASPEFSAESTDETTVVSPVASPPIGMKIETIASLNGEVGVALGTVATGGGFWAPPSPEDALQMLVLERDTLRVKANESFPNGTGGANSMLQAIGELTYQDLVVITKRNPTETEGGAESPAAAAIINKALAAIGVAPVPVAVSTGTTPCGVTGACSSFSAIGVPGTPVGQGDVNPGLAFGGTFRAGGLYGDLQENLAANGYVFVDRGRVPFDTGAEEEDPAVITVGNDQYKSVALEQPGFFVLALDAGTLQERGSFTYSLGTPPSTWVGSLQDMASELTQLAADPSMLVFVRSIGKVSRQAGAWDSVATQLQGLGGSRYLFEALDHGSGSTFFAQVGPGGQSGPGLSEWTQVASKERNGTGRLSGLLARNTSSQWYPNESTAPGTPVLATLPGILTMPQEAWPLRGVPRNEQIIECVADYFEFATRPIQANYVEQDPSRWSGLASDLDDATESLKDVNKQSGCEAVTAAEFEPIREQLKAEFEDVAAVQTLMTNLASPFDSKEGTNAELGSIADDVNEEVGAGSTSVEYNALGIVSDALWIVSSADTPIAPLLNLASGAFGLASELSQNKEGESTLANVSVPADELESTLNKQYYEAAKGLEREGEVFVSNWPMLRQAGLNALDKTDNVADWAWERKDAEKADAALGLAGRRTDYETLFPARYGLYRAQRGTGALNPEDVTTFGCQWPKISPQGWAYAEEVKPFKNVPRYGGVAPVFEGSGQVEQWVYANPDNAILKTEGGPSDFPSPNLLKKMFVGTKESEPLFDPLAFALGTYGNGSESQVVTHIRIETSAFEHSNEGCEIHSAPSP